MTRPNPLLERISKSRHGTVAEKRAAKRLGGQVTPGSGNKEYAKGDIRKTQFVIESKATVKASMSVKQAWLAKVQKEALDAGKDPALIIQFVDAYGNTVKSGSWVMIPERVFNELF